MAHEAATRLALPSVLQAVPYAQVKEWLISPDTAKNYLAFVERILHGEKESIGVYCKKLNNRWRWLSARSTSIFDLSGEPDTAIIAYIDITEAQENELVHKKWKQLLTVKKPEQYTLFCCNLRNLERNDAPLSQILSSSTEKLEIEKTVNRMVTASARNPARGDSENKGNGLIAPWCL